MGQNNIRLISIIFIVCCTMSMPAAGDSIGASSHEIVDACVDLGIIDIGCDDDDDRDNHEDDGDIDEREDEGDGDRDNHEDSDDENAHEGVPTETETETKTPPTVPTEPTVQPIDPAPTPTPTPTPTQTYDASAPIEETPADEVVTETPTPTQTPVETTIGTTIESPIDTPEPTQTTQTTTQSKLSTPSTPREQSDISETLPTRSPTPTTVPTPTDTKTQTAIASGFAVQTTTSGADGTAPTPPEQTPTAVFAPTQTDTTRTPTAGFTSTTDNTRNTSNTGDTRDASAPRNTATTVVETETEIGTTTPTATETTKTTDTLSRSPSELSPVNTSAVPIEDGHGKSRTPTQWLWMLLAGAIGASTVTLGIVVAQHGALGGDRSRARTRSQHVLGRLIDAASRYWFAIIGRVRDDEWLFSNDNRARVYETVRARPGETAATLADATDTSRTTARHHANMLSKAGKLNNDKRYGSKRYFPSDDSLSAAGQRLVAALRNESTAAIITAVHEADSRLTVSTIAETIDREQHTVSRQLDQLEDDDIIGSEQVGQEKYVALTERSSKLLQQDSIRQFCR